MNRRNFVIKLAELLEEYKIDKLTKVEKRKLARAIYGYILLQYDINRGIK